MYVNHLRLLEIRLAALARAIAIHGEGTAAQRQLIDEYIHLQGSHAFTRQMLLRYPPDAPRRYPGR